MGLKVSKTVKIEVGFPTKFINFKIHLKINGTSPTNQIHSRSTSKSPSSYHQLKIWIFKFNHVENRPQSRRNHQSWVRFFGRRASAKIENDPAGSTSTASLNRWLCNWRRPVGWVRWMETHFLHLLLSPTGTFGGDRTRDDPSDICQTTDMAISWTSQVAAWWHTTPFLMSIDEGRN